MSGRLHYGSESTAVQTQLVRAHWARVVVAAAAAARCCGANPKQTALALAGVQPFAGCLQPVRLPSGAVVLRDEHNGSVESFGPALNMLEQTQAWRRVLVTKEYLDGRADDCGGFLHLAPRIIRAADFVVLVGERAKRTGAALRSAGMPGDKVVMFESLPEAAQFCKREFVEGDLVLLKSTRPSHLSRLWLASFGEVNYWLPECFRICLCDRCDQAGPARLVAAGGNASRAASA